MQETLEREDYKEFLVLKDQKACQDQEVTQDLWESQVRKGSMDL
jgi:hypothetical protein